MSSKSNTQDEHAGFQAEERCRKVATGKEDEECIPESQPAFMRMQINVATNSPFGNSPLGNSFSAVPFKQSDFKPAIRQQEKEMTSEGNWLVGDDSLGRVPIDYPLERTSRIIAEPASVIANRISNCLCLRSIEADFDNKRAIAKCNTLDHVCFRVRLFAPRKEEDGPGTIVEIQKRRGDTISFLRDCRAILNAAEGGGVDVSSENVPIHINFDMAGDLNTQEKSDEVFLLEAIESAVELILKE